MNIRNRRIFQALLIVSSLAGSAVLAQLETISRTLCKKAHLERVVSHRVFEPDGAPCDVFYEKPLEGDYRAAEWNANNDASYCGKAYTQFVEKLRGMGWSCRYDLNNDLPRLAISSDQMDPSTRVRDHNGAFRGFINDYHVVTEAEQTFTVIGPTYGRLKVKISKRDNALEVVLIESYDGYGFCRQSGKEFPAMELAAWNAEPLVEVAPGVYSLKVSKPVYKARPDPGCITIPSEIGGLKWSNALIRIDSNVPTAAIFQTTKANRFEEIGGVSPGVVFSAIYSEFDDAMSFTLREEGYANCFLTVRVPVTQDAFRCDLETVSQGQ